MRLAPRSLLDILLLVAALAAPPRPARADDGLTVEARARFAEGVAAYDAGEYEAARTKFLQVYALKKHPDVLLNLGWSDLKSGRPDEARRAFEQYLEAAKDAPASKRADAERGLAEARGQVGTAETTSAGVLAPVSPDAAPDAQARSSSSFDVSALLGASTNGLNLGLGARGGILVERRIHLGAAFVYNIGHSTSGTVAGYSFESSTSAWYLGPEGGYDFPVGPVVLRPYAGLGVAVLSVSSKGPGGAVSASTTEVVLWPGVVGHYNLPGSRVTLGADVHLLTIPGGPAVCFFASAGVKL